MAEPTPETTQTSAPRWSTATEIRGAAEEPAADPGAAASGATPWVSLPEPSKLERLRLIVRNQDRELAELRHLVGELLRHQHGADGAMVVPLHITHERRNDRQPDPAKAWL